MGEFQKMIIYFYVIGGKLFEVLLQFYSVLSGFSSTVKGLWGNRN